MTRPPGKLSWVRLAGLVIGVALLVWLPFEDNGLSIVVFLAAVTCAWLAVRLLLASRVDGGKQVAFYLLVGALAGLMVAPLALVLMALKTGLHGHGTPDFSPAQLQAVLLRTPAWAGSGLLLGFGCGLWRLAHDRYTR
jgi:hypothetical protein